MSEQPSARPFATDGGRKWITMWYVFAFIALVGISVFLMAVVPALKDLQVDVLERLAALVAGTGATFMGVNGWVTVRTASAPDTMPADQEAVAATELVPDV